MYRFAVFLAITALWALPGCGKGAPTTRPATADAALAAVQALDCAGLKFPKDVSGGQWIRFDAKFVRKEADHSVFRGFADFHDVCLVKTAEETGRLKADQPVLIVARYDGFSMPKGGGGGDDELAGVLAQRKFSSAWIYPR